MSTTLLRKIDLRAILANHFATLVDDASGRKSGADFFLFYAVPVLPAAVMVWRDVLLSDGAIGIMTTALAILAGLLFNLLVLLHRLSGPDESHPVKGKARELAKQVYANIAYTIIVSLVSLIPLVIAANFDSSENGRGVYGFIAVYLVIHVVLTLFMVLKRMNVMLQDEMSSRPHDA